MDGYPWFRLYASEMLADEHFLFMTLAERGAWLTLIARCWVEGSIPSDIEQMAHLMGVDATALRPHYARICGRFAAHPTAHGRLISPRLEREREAVTAASKAKTESGKKAASARWGKGKSVQSLPVQDMRPQCDRNATALPSDVDTDPESEQSQTPAGGAGGGGLDSIRLRLAAGLGIPRVGLGKDGIRAAASFSRWLAAGIPESHVVSECLGIASDKRQTPGNLSWWAGWLDTVSDARLKAIAAECRERSEGGAA